MLSLHHTAYNANRSQYLFNLISSYSHRCQTTLIPPPQHINTSTPSPPIIPEMLPRLHRLSALNPPKPGSQEETDLLAGLNDLVNLMEGVKAVELPEGEDAIGSLLSEGVGEVVIGQGLEVGRGKVKAEEGEKKGKELLDWATRRVGDYYSTRIEKPKTP